MPANYRGALRPLKQIVPATAATADLVIVAIPWLTKIKDFELSRDTCDPSLKTVNIYGFEALASVNDNFSWRDLRACGDRLAEILNDHRRSQGEELRPLVLVTHSLAGFIVKQCLFVARELIDRYGFLVDAFAGVVFFGCPHAIAEDRRHILYERCNAILKLSNLNIRRNNSRLEADQEELLKACKLFDGICGTLKIVSIYEQRPTKLSHFGSWRTPQYLVDKLLARHGYTSIQEDTTGIDTDHLHLPSMRNREAPAEVDEEAMHGIAKILKPKRRPAIPVDQLTQPSNVKYPSLPFFTVGTSRQRNLNFSGREDILQQLAEHLLEGPQIAVLYGFGGLGKSETAREFVHRFRDHFNAVLWVQADDVSKMRHDFSHFAVALGLQDAQHRRDPFTSREVVKDWLINPIMKPITDGSNKAKWLMVFDGADDPKVLSEFRSIVGKGSVIITGKDPSTVQMFADSSATTSSGSKQPLAIQMKPFQKEEAAIALRRLANLPLDEEQNVAQQIVTLLDGWPLAISQMAGIIRTQYLTLTQFYERYSNVADRQNLEAQESAFAPEIGQNTMVTSMRMAKLSPQATAVLQIFSMLDPDCIQQLLFTEPVLDAPLDAIPKTQDEFEKARNELLRSSLVEINKSTQELFMHRVLQETVRRQCTKQEYDHSFRSAAMIVKSAFRPPEPGVRDSLKLWEPCAALLRHVLHLQQVYETQAKSHASTGSIVQPCFDFAWLLSEVVTFQRHLGNTPGLRSTLLLALSICDSLPDKDTFELHCEIYHSIGATANVTNNAEECVRYNTLFLDMAKSALDEGAPLSHRIAGAYNQYGTCQMMIDNYESAIHAFERSIEIYKSIPSDIPCPDSLPRVNLAIAKWLTRDYQAAATLLESGYLAREEAFGFMDTESFRTGRFYHALGNVRWSQGRSEDSEIWHKRALKQYLSVLGPLHHRTADVRHKVAEHCLRREDYVNAGTLIDRALMSWQLDAPSFQQEIARTTWLKARQRGMSGNPVECRKLREEAYRMRQRLVPHDTRLCEELVDADFDELVTFWSR